VENCRMYRRTKDAEHCRMYRRCGKLSNVSEDTRKMRNTVECRVSVRLSVSQSVSPSVHS